MQTRTLLTRVLAGGVILAGGMAWPGSTLAQDPQNPVAEAGEGQPARRPILNYLKNHFHRAWELRSKLNLTDEQRAKIRSTIAAQKEEIVNQFKKVAEKRQALRDAVLAEMPTEESIRAAADELGKAIGDAAVKASQIAGDLRKNLTSEQLEKIRKFREKQRAEFDKLLDKALAE